ncbi:AGE family epimerase/isomerase [Naasia sp. SYSU D00057]|uniref:AGE family epimerase/isomerase n=1 Tax=Naasia sp. SYSU D00057 TaxID=2817380 RepID=UPI001B3009E6|nr:AGE family epimerase/isomerase [Naasia sp. SYSU D00057]
MTVTFGRDDNSAPPFPALAGDPDSPAHFAALAAEEARLLAFFSTGDDESRFLWRDLRGQPDPDRPEQLYAAARLVHCFSVEHLLGHPYAGRWAEQGAHRLLTRFADREFGGFVASVALDGTVTSDTKETYGHAFALLAGVSAKKAGIAGGNELFSAAGRAIDDHLWDERHSAAIESCSRDWSTAERYRGQNGNMHLTEAYLAAYEATREPKFLERAEAIAERLVRGGAGEAGWRIPEHYREDWTVDRDYAADRPDDPFRPYGTLVGHSLEWARLLLQLGALRPGARSWTTDAAEALFARGIADGWDEERGGFAYSVDFDGGVVNASRMHWTIAEAIGAALWLYRITGNGVYRDRYSEFWDYAERLVLDRHQGSWWHELDAENRPSTVTWDGKPDLYHAWQATLYARVHGDRGLADAAASGGITPLQQGTEIR